MIIQCTKKLLDELGIKPVEKIEEKPLFSWHANIITVNRRKTVVLVNDKNRYTIVLYGLKTREFKRFDEVVLKGIREAFRDECIKDEIIEDFIRSSGEIFYTRTKDRSFVARMNKQSELVPAFEDNIIEKEIYQTSISRRISRYLVGDGEGDYMSPNEEFLEILEDREHPEHRFMAEWGNAQGYREFDIEKVNKDISFSFRMIG